MKKTVLILLTLLFTILPSVSYAQDNTEEPEPVTTEETSTTIQGEEVGQQNIGNFQVNSEVVINTRSNPSTTASIVGVLQPGAIIPVLEVVDGSLVEGNSLWYRIEVNGRDAYVHSSLLIPGSSLPNQNVILDLPGTFLPTITVTAVGTAFVEPNVVALEFGFERIGTDAGLVFEGVENAQTAVYDALLGANINSDDIDAKLTSISNEDLIDANGGITGEFVFRGESSITVYIYDLDNVSEIVLLAFTNGANSVENITYTRDDFSEAEDEARQDAISEAFADALDITNQANITLGPAVTIRTSAYTIENASEAVVNAGSIVATSPTPQNITVTVTLEVTYGVLTR